MNPDTTNIIYGPPGTGKTTALLETVEHLLEDGFPPESICFISFTRKAANEAKTRAMEKFSFQESSLPWFRTLHSLAFQRLGVEKRNVMGIRDYFTLADSLGLTITTKSVNEDGTMACMTKGDRLFFMENMARATMKELHTFWEQFPDEDIYWYEFSRVAETIKQYKIAHGKLDFTDMIYRYLEESMTVPGIRVLIVDEAQDLSPLQWQMIEMLAAQVEETYIAGDDDQAIFKWAGADVDRLINLQGSRRVLHQSYRVPAEVQQVANAIAARIANRVSKTWSPRQAIGTVDYVTGLDQIDMSQGTWLLLGRNAYLLDQYIHYCMQQGYIFEAQGQSLIRGNSFRAIKIWENLRAGKTIVGQQAKLLYEYFTTKVGVAYGYKKKIDAVADNCSITLRQLRSEFGLLTEAPWFDALDKLSDQEREYFLAALRRGENLSDDPRIKISTIHGVKGGEADNVVILTDMADRSFKEYQSNPDDEHRVWYVAVTRAKEKLVVVQPSTNRSYEI